VEYTLCREASNLGIEPMPCFVYCLGDLQLALLIVANTANPDSSAEIPEYALVSFADNCLKRFNLFAQLIMGSSSSVDLRCQHIQLVSDVLQLLQDASSMETGSVLGRLRTANTRMGPDHLPDRL